MRMNYRELIDRKIADSLISLFRSGLDAGALVGASFGMLAADGVVAFALRRKLAK